MPTGHEPQAAAILFAEKLMGQEVFIDGDVNKINRNRIDTDYGGKTPYGIASWVQDLINDAVKTATHWTFTHPDSVCCNPAVDVTVTIGDVLSVGHPMCECGVEMQIVEEKE